ncbi:MAG: GatB/YqeY domain-containing protein [Spirochaetes bacterium]|nr:GatB/YqeY domain-containing protein [Spirochaetota bacterium]
MGLLERIESDLRDSIRNKNEEVMRTLRMLKSDIMYEKAKGSGDLTEEKLIEIVKRAAKKRKEAIEEFRKAGRTDLIEKETSELAIIERYLPTQLAADEIERIIDEKLKSLGEVSKKDFGKIMGIIMKDLKGQADGALVKEILTKKIENL